jgi:hypothetical protein
MRSAGEPVLRVLLLPDRRGGRDRVRRAVPRAGGAAGEHDRGRGVSASAQIGRLRAAAIAVQEALSAQVEAGCAGPHRPVQHRDRWPPWCPVCRYTAHGLYVSPDAGLGPGGKDKAAGGRGR